MVRAMNGPYCDEPRGEIAPAPKRSLIRSHRTRASLCRSISVRRFSSIIESGVFSRTTRASAVVSRWKGMVSRLAMAARHTESPVAAAPILKGPTA
ncbi:MAG: hypothetical protein R3F14_09280 [Polyangiaceae bacterium]